MEITEEDARDAKEFSDVAVIIIGRTAGEDKDFTNDRGSYKLSLTELNMIKMSQKFLIKLFNFKRWDNYRFMNWRWC